MAIMLTQAIIDTVFKGYMLYLIPILFILMVIMVADRLLDLIVNSFLINKSNRRNSY